MLQNPFGWVHEHTKERLLSYATCVFEDIRKYGDVKLWWKKNKELYKGWDYGDDFYEVKHGAQHFWKRVAFVDLTAIEEHVDNSEDDDAPSIKSSRFNNNTNKNNISVIDFNEVLDSFKDGIEDEDDDMSTSSSFEIGIYPEKIIKPDDDDMSMDLTDNTDQEIHEILEIARNEPNSQMTMELIGSANQ